MAKIGMIGLGAMGGPMAGNLLKSNHAVKVYDTTSERVDALIVHGASRATSSSVADDVEVVITMLPNGEAVSDVLLGEDGLLNRSSKGTLFIDSSTIEVKTAKALARFASTSVRFSPACLRPLKNNAIRRPSRVDTTPEVNSPVRCFLALPSTESSANAFCLARLPISSRILTVVSSL